MVLNMTFKSLSAAAVLLSSAFVLAVTWRKNRFKQKLPSSHHKLQLANKQRQKKHPTHLKKMVLTNSTVADKREVTGYCWRQNSQSDYDNLTIKVNVNRLTQEWSAKWKIVYFRLEYQSYNEGLVAKQKPSDVEVTCAHAHTSIFCWICNKLIEVAKKVTLLKSKVKQHQ